MKQVVLLLVGSVAWGCGASYRAPEISAPQTLDAPGLLLGFIGEADPWFRPPPNPPDVVATSLRELRGDARREGTAQLALAHLFAAQISLPEEATRHHREAKRWATRALGQTRDPQQRTRLGFIDVWASWRLAQPNAERLAAQFIDRNSEGAPFYVQVAMMIRAEIEFEAGNWTEAKDAYRYVLGDLEHPLYGYALLRSAYCLGNLGRQDEALDALRYVQEMGCGAANGPATDVSALAARALHTPVDHCDGRWVPRTCGCASDGK